MYALQLDLVFEADTAPQEKEPIGINNPLLYHQGIVEVAKDETKHVLSPNRVPEADVARSPEDAAGTAHDLDAWPCRKRRRVVVTSIFCSENGISEPPR